MRSLLTVTHNSLLFMNTTYVFDGNQPNGGGLDSNLAAALLSQGRNNGFGGNDGLWGVIYLAIIASIFGWNRGGFGGFGGFGGGSAIPAELSGDAGRELLMQAIQGNRESIGQIASSLSCSTQQVQTALCNIQSTLGLTGQQIINAVQSGDSGIINQLSSCCCNILSAVERQGAATQLQNCQNVNALTNTINGGVRDLKDSGDANSRAILAKLDAAETNNEHQTASILSSVGQQLAPVVAGLNALQSEVDGIKCKLPNTVPVQWPNIVGVNLDTYRAAAYGAAAGNYAGAYCNNGYWG